MDSALAFMIERSRHHADRFKAHLAAGPPDPDQTRTQLVEDAANALIACQFIQVRGGVFARSRAEKTQAEIQSAIRQARLEAALALRLQEKITMLGSMFAKP